MYEEILKFWFEDIDESKWWKKDEEFDNLIREKYSGIHAAANRCELHEWRTTAVGRLAEVIVLDQFSRNLYRGQALSFASDPLALVLAQEAVSAGADKEISETERSFLYMPFMHSESRKIHEVAVSLFESGASKSILQYELNHKAIIDRFGRYPHRNQILHRESTEEEIEFLKQPGSGF